MAIPKNKIATIETKIFGNVAFLHSSVQESINKAIRYELPRFSKRLAEEVRKHMVGPKGRDSVKQRSGRLYESVKVLPQKKIADGMWDAGIEIGSKIPWLTKHVSPNLQEHTYVIRPKAGGALAIPIIAKTLHRNQLKSLTKVTIDDDWFHPNKNKTSLAGKGLALVKGGGKKAGKTFALLAEKHGSYVTPMFLLTKEPIVGHTRVYPQRISNQLAPSFKQQLLDRVRIEVAGVRRNLSNVMQSGTGHAVGGLKVR